MPQEKEFSALIKKKFAQLVLILKVAVFSNPPQILSRYVTNISKKKGWQHYHPQAKIFIRPSKIKLK